MSRNRFFAHLNIGYIYISEMLRVPHIVFRNEDWNKRFFRLQKPYFRSMASSIPVEGKRAEV